MWEKEKMLAISIFSFSYNISLSPHNNCSFWVTFILSSVNVTNLDWSKISLFG